MGTVTTGRTLEDGEPIDGTGFTVPESGPVASALAERDGPLTSHPTRQSWGTLPTPTDEDTGTLRALTVLGPDYDGPPEHYHEVSRERFTVEQGAVVFELDGDERHLTAGETLTVPTGVRHSFRPSGSGLTLLRTEISPPGRLGHVLPTLGGIAHDEVVSTRDPLQRVAIAKRLDGDTVFTDPDPRVAKPLTDLLAPVARLRGYRGAYDKYRRPAFWERHVEQPDV